MEQLTQFNIFKLMKKVQSAYFFSLLLFSSSLILLILHSVKSYSVISLDSVMKFNIDRNHVFLICNGILVYIVKSSSSSPSQESNSSDYSSNAVQNEQCLPRPIVLSDQKKQEEFSAVISEQKVTTGVKVAHSSTIEENHVQLHQKVVSECQIHPHGDDNDDDDHDHDHEDEDDDHDHEYEEGAEELNKRCEEFIRRMKQGIISETKKELGLTRFS